eukprot:49504-Amphidinium_carterae.1
MEDLVQFRCSTGRRNLSDRIVRQARHLRTLEAFSHKLGRSCTKMTPLLLCARTYTHTHHRNATLEANADIEQQIIICNDQREKEHHLSHILRTPPGQ